VETFYDDGGYDKRGIYNLLGSENIRPVVPLRRDAEVKQHASASLHEATLIEPIFET